MEKNFHVRPSGAVRRVRKGKITSDVPGLHQKLANDTTKGELWVA